MSRYFEDFKLGQVISHATPRTLTDGDQAMYMALYGSRFALHSSAPFATALGYPDMPLDDLLTFHTVFGKTVPDVSINAVANLGYAQGLFHAPVVAGDTLRAESEVIGLKQNSNGKTGTVYVHTRGFNQRDELALEYRRWVLVEKRDADAPAPEPSVPDLPDAVAASDLIAPAGFNAGGYDFVAAGSAKRFADFQVGEKIDHGPGQTVEEAEHQLATRLYQNTAKVHFDGHAAQAGRFGKRLIYGGHVISVARAMSFNGLENAFALAAINGGTHKAPLFAGDTVYAWTEVLDKAEVADGLGALRLRTIATKNAPCTDFPPTDDDATILIFDYWAWCV